VAPRGGGSRGVGGGREGAVGGARNGIPGGDWDRVGTFNDFVKPGEVRLRKEEEG
jgi:hypothetical protein